MINLFKYPLVSKNELAKYLGVNYNKILGIGTDPNIPDDIMNKAMITENKSRLKI